MLFGTIHGDQAGLLSQYPIWQNILLHCSTSKKMELPSSNQPEMNIPERIILLEAQILEHQAAISTLSAQLSSLRAQHTYSTSITYPGSLASNPPKKTEQQFPLSQAEYTRYSRHLILPAIGLHGYLALRSASLLIIGAGGLGCPAAAYLAAAGVGHIGIIDGDVVETGNLQRQIMYTVDDIGSNKALALVTHLKKHASHNFTISH
jgi:adenylyltransferase and sulfurtransferase